MVIGDDSQSKDSRHSSSRDDFLVGVDEQEQIRTQICEFITAEVANADASGVVVAMSGGVDSTLTALLAVEALGCDQVLGLGLPASKHPDDGLSEARTIADGLGIEFREIALRPLLDMFEETVASTVSPENGAAAIGNVIARLRMICAYYVANTQSRLVCGTTNRSELLLGYFTKYGDGGADLYPLGDLYKTEVYSLAYHCGVPRRIIEKDPTAGLPPNRTDETELGARYGVIDPLLRHTVDYGECIETAVESLSIESETAIQIMSRSLDTVHKRAAPPTPRIGARDDVQSPYSVQLAEQLPW
jgi:NAD+ synthase